MVEMIHRYIFVILLLSAMPLCINAQVSEVQSFEGEINVGVSAPFRHIHHLRINLSATIAGTKSTGWSISIGGVIGGRPRKSQRPVASEIM